MNFHAKLYQKKLTTKNHFFMERNSLDKNSDQPCLTSCSRRAQGAGKVASPITRESMSSVCLSGHGFCCSPCSFLPALTHLQEGSTAGRKSL